MNSSQTAQTSRVGELVGSYRLVRFIGAGGMGEVYEAQHTTLGTRRAVKFLRRDLVGRVDLVARFEQEARIAGTLESRHIIKVRDSCRDDDGRPYMVMDLAEGRSLARILAEQGRFDVSRAVGLVHQACAGLRVAHDAKIVHRDLKPDNLYVCCEDDGSELLKILDFGIAKHLGGNDRGPTTETGSNLGTAHYMSPEQAQGAKHIDHRTDIYSLGVILYEMLSGTKPYDGESYNEILIRIVTQRPVPLDALCPDLPRGLVSVVRRAMARQPAERFQSAVEFADALARLRTHALESTDLGPALRPATRPRSSAMDTLASGSDARSWPSSLRRPFFLAIVAVAAITTGALALRSTSGDTPAPSSNKRAQPSLEHKRGETQPRAGMGGRLVSQAADTALFAAEVPTSRPVTSAKSSSGTSAPGRYGGQPQAIRPPSLVRPRMATAAAQRADQGPATKPPTIDEPLPPSPHAPGVSPVME